VKKLLTSAAVGMILMLILSGCSIQSLKLTATPLSQTSIKLNLARIVLFSMKKMILIAHAVYVNKVTFIYDCEKFEKDPIYA